MGRRASVVLATATPTEIEIKLALPGVDAQAVVAALAASPVLARRKHQRQTVFSQYFDTPEQALRRQRVALRLRRLDGGSSTEQPQWRQTLKTAGQGDSALSVRGEWEMAVPGPALALELLHNSPWPQMDAQGTLSATLQPCFVTEFERTTWQVRQRDGSHIEVALDIGTITAEGRSVPLCELELELLAGPPAALFALAQRIARTVAVLPLAASKAERGFNLQQSATVAPVLAKPPAVTAKAPLSAIARRVLGEAFVQFTANLYALQTAEAPELVHQTRVGWRRFRSLWQLLHPLLTSIALPSLEALRPLLDSLGHLRDSDVARTQTLPPLAQASALDNLHVSGDEVMQEWERLQTVLAQAAHQELLVVRSLLAEPAVGAALLDLSHWLETIDGPLAATVPLPKRKAKAKAQNKAQKRDIQALRQRAMQQAQRLDQLVAQCIHDHTPEGIERQHRVRILAKRLRYSVHALAPILPKHLQQQHRVAQALQERLGTERDLLQARHLAARCGGSPLWLAFLQGVAVARALNHPPQQ